MPISATITRREILVVRNSTRDRNCSISQLYRLWRRPAIKDISGRSSSRLGIQKSLSGRPSRSAIFVHHERVALRQKVISHSFDLLIDYCTERKVLIFNPYTVARRYQCQRRRNRATIRSGNGKEEHMSA